MGFFTRAYRMKHLRSNFREVWTQVFGIINCNDSTVLQVPGIVVLPTSVAPGNEFVLIEDLRDCRASPCVNDWKENFKITSGIFFA